MANDADVVDCMVDRVSTGREVGAADIRVTAEAWRGAIVSLDAEANARRAPPFGTGAGAEVLAPTSKAAAKFLSDRKLELVDPPRVAFFLRRVAAPPRPGRG